MKEAFIGILILLSLAAWVFYTRKAGKEALEEGIETEGIITRIEDTYGAQRADARVFARYTADGEETEGEVLGAPAGLRAGQRVRLRCHPRSRQKAAFIRTEEEER